jgi:hypothetical protein
LGDCSTSLSSGELVRACSRFKIIEVSVDDLEWAILRASVDKGRLDEEQAPVPVCSTGPMLLSGDPSLLCSIERTAASRSSSRMPRPPGYGDSSSLEFGADSGGEITAPGGMTALFNGGGDCLRLAWESMEGGARETGSEADCTVALQIEGLLRCRRT